MALSATVASRIVCRNTGDRQAPEAQGRPQPASHHASCTTLWDAGLLFPSFLSTRSSLCDKNKQSIDVTAEKARFCMDSTTQPGWDPGSCAPCGPRERGAQETFGRRKAETGQLTAAVWGSLCAASLHSFLLFWRKQCAFYLT